ncbi:MAG: response regulator [Gammaproteobacteria bacterium]|nr:response regulator [Gammaproteobacteria bacterium]
MKIGRLLVIDDDPRLRTSLTGLVEDAGHRVVGAGEGEDAVRLLGEGEDADLILLDLNMPGVHGFDVLALVRTLDHPPAVIVLTAEQREDQLRHLLRYGADDCLRKPYEPDDLLASIRETLDRRSRTDATEEMLERLRASDRLHRFLVEQSPDVIYTLDREGRFTFLSASAEQVFGQPRRNWSASPGPGCSRPANERLGRPRFNERRTGDRAARNVELRLADGTFDAPRWVQVSATGLYRQGDSGPDALAERNYEGTYGIVRDVTALREQQDARPAGIPAGTGTSHGGHRPAGRRHRPRLQQHPGEHDRLRGTGPGVDRPRSRTGQRLPGRGGGRCQPPRPRPDRPAAQPVATRPGFAAPGAARHRDRRCRPDAARRDPRLGPDRAGHHRNAGVGADRPRAVAAGGAEPVHQRP